MLLEERDDSAAAQGKKKERRLFSCLYKKIEALLQLRKWCCYERLG